MLYADFSLGHFFFSISFSTLFLSQHFFFGESFSAKSFLANAKGQAAASSTTTVPLPQYYCHCKQVKVELPAAGQPTTGQFVIIGYTVTDVFSGCFRTIQNNSG